MSYTIGLAGNPNAGKSTLFNALTGSHQHVGNWPGKTVEKKEGQIRLAGRDLVLVDLPGTYSLNAFSVEEVIARDFIVHQRPDALVVVIDATNLERNLYLVLQLIEMNVPLILALNMSDVAEAKQIHIDDQKLAQRLGIPVVKTVGNRATGIGALKTAIRSLTENQPTDLRAGSFPAALEAEIARLQTLIEQDSDLRTYPARWFAIKLLEAEPDITAKIDQKEPLIAAVQDATMRLMQTTGEDPETLIADARYGLISQIIRDVMTRPPKEVLRLSDSLDRVLTNRVLGLPIFLSLMWFVFQITANVSAPFVDWIDSVINGLLAHRVSALLQTLSLEDTWLNSVLIDGVVAGVGSVLVFVPVLASLYLALALLEDSGYMARAAFVMDRAMHGLGLHGKSFLPLLVGFGCNVPAIYATRTLENETDRKITGFLVPFMSCGARLPVYVLFGSIFFKESIGNFVFAMYLAGILVAVVTSVLLSKVVFKDKANPPFVMELPSYRLPHAKTVFRQVWERTATFIKEAGTIILAVSVIIWLLMAIPLKAGSHFNEVEAADSVLGKSSRVIAPLFAPAGFGEWQAISALVTGAAAKEIVVATMTQTFTHDSVDTEESLPSFREDIRAASVGFGDATVLTLQELLNIVPNTINLMPGIDIGEISFREQAAEPEESSALETGLRNTLTPAAAAAFSIFVLLYIPCGATVAALRQEFGSRWASAQVVYGLCVAWLAATIVYQVGSMLS